LVLGIAYETVIGLWPANTSVASSDARGTIRSTLGINAGWLILLALSTFNCQLSTCFGQGTAFTY
jgi:hypothetical protein